MEKVNFSKNSKLNFVLNFIHEDLLSICESKNESIEQIARYKSNFKNESDYNIAQYGNVLIYYCQVRELYRDYKSLQKMSDSKLWEIYKRQVGYVANYILNNFNH